MPHFLHAPEATRTPTGEDTKLSGEAASPGAAAQKEDDHDDLYGDLYGGLDDEGAADMVVSGDDERKGDGGDSVVGDNAAKGGNLNGGSAGAEGGDGLAAEDVSTRAVMNALKVSYSTIDCLLD